MKKTPTFTAVPWADLLDPNTMLVHDLDTESQDNNPTSNMWSWNSKSTRKWTKAVSKASGTTTPKKKNSIALVRLVS